MGRIGEFILNHWFLSLSLVVIVVLLVVETLKLKLLGFQDIKPHDAVRLINQEGAIAVDVREDREYHQGHVLNAVNIPLGLMEERLHELDASRSLPLIVYCRTGQRAAHAAVTLRKQGFERVYKLRGGIMGWRGADLPVVKSGG